MCLLGLLRSDDRLVGPEWFQWSPSTPSRGENKEFTFKYQEKHAITKLNEQYTLENEGLSNEPFNFTKGSL